MSCTLAIALLLTLFASGGAPAASARGANLTRSAVFDADSSLDINNLGLRLSNSGWFGYDPYTASAGLEFPRGTGKTCVFSAGLWFGARVNGAVRMAVAEYGNEFGPGAMVGTAADNSGKAEYKVYKLNREYADPALRDLALADYNAGAVPHGAPAVATLGDGTLGIRGDQMAWSLFNDANPALHQDAAGNTAPLGIEVRETVFAFARPGALGNTVFLEFRIFNKGGKSLDSAYVSLWSDPDVGGFSDDFVGCTPASALGFAYNATNADAVYGAAVPAVGFDLFRGPRVGTSTLPMTSFNKYVNGNDPQNATESYNLMKGLNRDGSTLIDPVSGQPTTFAVSGDPLAGTGWLDANPSDRRLMLSSGPFSMAPGDSQVILAGIVVGQGADRLQSLAILRSYADVARGYATTGNDQLSVPAPPRAAGLALALLGPNPTASRLSLACTCVRRGAGRLAVLDATGRRVLARDLGLLEPGRHTVRLDMGAAGPGLYFVELRQGGETALTRTVILR